MPNEAQRHSRYHCSGKRPPYLKKVMAQFAKAVRGKGYVPNKGVAQSVCAKGDREYDNVNRANELVSFLKNTGILIESPVLGDDRLFYDATRAVEVMYCCNQAREPGPAEADAVRLERIKVQFGTAEAVVVDSVEEVHQPDKTSGLGQAPTTQAVQAPAAPSNPNPLVTHVLYLTPLEKEVWMALFNEAEEAPDGVQSRMPWEPCSDRCQWVRQLLSCGETEYVCIVQRFVLAKVLERIQVSGDKHAVFRFTRHPFAYHLVDIDTRQVLAIPGADLEASRAAQTEFEIPRGGYLNPALEAWAARKFGDKLNVIAWRNKVVGYRPGDKYKGWGILFRKGSHPGRPKLEEVETYMSIPGFEAYDFRAREDMPVVNPLPASSETVPAPAPVGMSVPADPPMSVTMPSPAPVEGVPDPVVAAQVAVTVIDGTPADDQIPVEVPSLFPPEHTTMPSHVVEDDVPPESPRPASPVIVQDDRTAPAPSAIPASIEAMGDDELEAKLAEWHRMHEIAQQELLRRRTDKIQRLSAEIADNQFKLTVVVSEAVELEQTAAIKRKQASELEGLLAKLRSDLAAVESKS